jgi:chaperonin cofactor prefoldin
MTEASITLETLAETVERLGERVKALERQAGSVDVQAEYEKMRAASPHLEWRFR